MTSYLTTLSPAIGNFRKCLYATILALRLSIKFRVASNVLWSDSFEGKGESKRWGEGILGMIPIEIVTKNVVKKDQICRNNRSEFIKRADIGRTNQTRENL